MGRWITVQSGMQAPMEPGVYALVSSYAEPPLYIGQTNCLRNRLRAHQWAVSPGGVVVTPWGPVPGFVKYRQCTRFGEWLMVEARLIRRLRPTRNKAGITEREADLGAACYLAPAPPASVDTFRRPLISLQELSVFSKLDINHLRNVMAGMVVEAVSRSAVRWVEGEYFLEWVPDAMGDEKKSRAVSA